MSDLEDAIARVRRYLDRCAADGPWPPDSGESDDLRTVLGGLKEYMQAAEAEAELADDFRADWLAERKLADQLAEALAAAKDKAGGRLWPEVLVADALKAHEEARHG